MKTNVQYILISSIIISLLLVSFTLTVFEYFKVNLEPVVYVLLIAVEIYTIVVISVKLINR